jgi:hypothetical protein
LKDWSKGDRTWARIKKYFRRMIAKKLEGAMP